MAVAGGEDQREAVRKTGMWRRQNEVAGGEARGRGALDAQAMGKKKEAVEWVGWEEEGASAADGMRPRAATTSCGETRRRGRHVATAARGGRQVQHERLKLIYKDKLRKRIGMGNVAVTLALVEQHHCRMLKDARIEFLASPGNLKAAMATDGYGHMKETWPSVLVELTMKQLA
ncbi:hypothetical protein E2562_026712 [Oryza meyeriana var. granulata]|uniref:BPM/SPOP BACK domain-containing protein n=1 Tax=Oryza meyeriana var. granulata TaxID=110450 RepID=A0A6G1E2E2_9ORYZ|nr:hypothetical protein E2562_026712 [Oryza meyeriana var. granulata]